MPIVRCDRCHEGSYVLFGRSRARRCGNCGAPVAFLEPAGTRFAIAAARGRVQRILGIAGIDRSLDVYPDASTALREVGTVVGA